MKINQEGNGTDNWRFWNQTLKQQGQVPQQPQMVQEQQMAVPNSQQPQTSQLYPMAPPINVHFGNTQGRYRGPRRGRWQGGRLPWGRWTSPSTQMGQGYAPQGPRGSQGPGYSQEVACHQYQQPPTCWGCGETGHMRRDCPDMLQPPIGPGMGPKPNWS